MIRYHKMTEIEKEIISAWCYTGDYAVYNMPSYQEQKKQGIGFGNPKCEDNFYAYYDETQLIGFTNILEEPQEVFMGIGVAPDHCGKGYGEKILRIAQQISQTQYPHKAIYLEVRTWNQRAIHCYEKAGFILDGKAFEQKTMLGTSHFIRMVYPVR